MVAGVEDEVERLLADGKAAARSGNRDGARELLTQVVEHDPHNEQAWMWLSGVVDAPEEQQICLENVLVINPGNDKARKGLEYISAKTGITPNLPGFVDETTAADESASTGERGELTHATESAAESQEDALPDVPNVEPSAQTAPSWLYEVEPGLDDNRPRPAPHADVEANPLWGNLPESTADDPLAIWSRPSQESRVSPSSPSFDMSLGSAWAPRTPVGAVEVSEAELDLPADVQPFSPFDDRGAPSASSAALSSPFMHEEPAPMLDLGPMGPAGSAHLPSPAELPQFSSDAQQEMQPWYLQGNTVKETVSAPVYEDEEDVEAGPKQKVVPTVPCPSCSEQVPETALQCQKCRYSFFVNCPHCHELVDASNAKPGVLDACPYCKTDVDRFRLGVAGTDRAATYESRLVPAVPLDEAAIKQLSELEEKRRARPRVGFGWIVDVLWLVVIVATVWALSQLPTWLQLVGQY